MAGKQRKVVRKPKLWSRDPQCPKCRGKGWIYVPDPEADKLYNRKDSVIVRRCYEPDCLRLDEE